jgi:hypothetical protein
MLDQRARPAYHAAPVDAHLPWNTRVVRERGFANADILL